MSSAHPVPSPTPIPPLLCPSLPSFPLPPFPFPPLPLKRGSVGPPPENFEILDCCRRVLAHSGMQKGGLQMCVFRSRYEKIFLVAV